MLGVGFVWFCFGLVWFVLLGDDETMMGVGKGGKTNGDFTCRRESEVR